jgi:hypothetical protein
MHIEETIEDTLFIPNDYYIRLLQEFNTMAISKRKTQAYVTVRQELADIEIKMPVGDIIRNTKLAFNH